MSDLTNDLLAAVVAATPERKESALKVLRGDPEPERSTVQGKGPLLLGMNAASEFLGVSRSTLWRIIQAGTIAKVELFPGSFRVRREDLVALAAGEFGSSGKKSRRGQVAKKASRRKAVGRRQKRTETDRTGDPRFQQLKALVDEGDENAVGDLFREFDYDHAAGRFVGPPSTPAHPGELRRGDSAIAESDGVA